MEEPANVGVLSVPGSSQSKDAPLPKSYGRVVNNRSTLSKFNVDVSVIEGKFMVAVPDEVFEEVFPLWRISLLDVFQRKRPM